MYNNYIINKMNNILLIDYIIEKYNENINILKDKENIFIELNNIFNTYTYNGQNNNDKIKKHFPKSENLTIDEYILFCNKF